MEEKKFLEILNQTSANVTPILAKIDDSLELSPPSTMMKKEINSSAKRLQVHVPPLKTTSLNP